MNFRSARVTNLHQYSFELASGGLNKTHQVACDSDLFRFAMRYMACIDSTYVNPSVDFNFAFC